MNTTLSPCAAGLTGLFMKAALSKFKHGHRNYNLMTFGNSVLAGLVAITSACSTVLPWAALIIGAVAGIVYNIGSQVWAAAAAASLLSLASSAAGVLVGELHIDEKGGGCMSGRAW